METLWSDLPEQNGQPDHGTVATDALRPNDTAYASSISFSSPRQSEPDSDFATDGAGTEAGHRKPGSSDDEISDDSTYGATRRKRRKVQPEKPPKRVRPEVDNDQTRKLRSALPSEEPSLHAVPSVPSMQHTNGFESSAMQASNSAAPPEDAELDSDEEQEMDSQSQAVERHLTQQEHAEQLRQVQSMWQMAAILEFLHTFSLHLRLRGSFTPEELEVAIVSETAQTGLLANLHQDLLRGITSRSDLNSDNWAAHFANRLKYQWVSTHLRGSPPFAPLKRHEAHDYAALHAADRVLALKLLCEIRLDKDDLRSAIELAMKPVKPPSRPPSGKTRAGGSSVRGRPEPAPEPTMDVRHEPLGEDANGVMYWYLDLGPEGHTSLTGVRLYKETAAQPPASPSPSPAKPIKGAKDQAGAKGKAPKGRGKKAKKQGGLGGSLVAPPAEPSWELLASSTDELQAVGEDLTGQPANAEADIGYQILDDIVPNLVARAEAQEKRARAAAKVAAQLNSVVPDDNGHYGRSRRQRTQVNYNYDEYDKTIKDAIRGGRNELLLASARPQKDWSRPPPIESRRAGLRGGKPEEQAHSSPDENRPSNDQAGAVEASTDGAGSGSHAESQQQPGPELADGIARYHVEDFRPDVSEYGDEMQHDVNDNQGYMHDGHDHHAAWGSQAAVAPMFHRSFAVGAEPVNSNAVPYMNSGETHPSYFT